MQEYYRRATAVTAAAEVPAAVAAPVRLAYAEVLLERDLSAAERVLREQLDAPSSEDVRSAALLLLGRAFETGGRWDEAQSLYRGLALSGTGGGGRPRSPGRGPRPGRYRGRGRRRPKNTAPWRCASPSSPRSQPKPGTAARWRIATPATAKPRRCSCAASASGFRLRAGRGAPAEEFPASDGGPLRSAGGSAQQRGAQRAAPTLAYRGERAAPGQQRCDGRRRPVQDDVARGGHERHQPRHQGAPCSGVQIGIRVQQGEIVRRRGGRVQGDLVAQGERRLRHPVGRQIGARGEELQGIAAGQREAQPAAGRLGAQPPAAARASHTGRWP